MLISVVINNYNYAPFLRSCIDSCLHQGYEKKEIIVVDDGSNDNSREVIELVWSASELHIQIQRRTGFGVKFWVCFKLWRCCCFLGFRRCFAFELPSEY